MGERGRELDNISITEDILFFIEGWMRGHLSKRNL